MASTGDRIPEEAARAIWRRAAQLQAEAERRLEERARQLPGEHGGEPSESEGLLLDEVRMAAEEAGIAPEFVQIALAEAAASPGPVSPESRADLLGAAVIGGGAIAAWGAMYRYYVSQVELALEQSLQLLPGTARAIAAHRGGRDPARRALPSPQW